MSGAFPSTVEPALAALAAGTCDDAFAVLGRHPDPTDSTRAIVRTVQPQSSGVDVVLDDGVVPMSRVRSEGVFEASVPLGGVPLATLPYRLRVRRGSVTVDLID